MKEDDFFNFILFGSEVHTWKETLIKATPENLDEARKFVRGIDTRGSKHFTGIANRSLCKLSVQSVNMMLKIFIFLLLMRRS